MANVKIEKLEKVYPNGVQALFPIDLEISDGEFVVLVGPSGCGKSTLLRTLAGLEEATRGRITLGGRDITSLAPSERNMAMVFQDYALYPHMNVRDNLTFGLRMRKTPKTEIEERLRSVSALLMIESLLDRKPAQLSGGQRQRIAIGRAIARRPEVFLFDEPLSNLDAQLRAQTRVELAALQRKLGTTAIYVTHDQVEAMSLADRIVVLNEGRIQQFAAPMELYQKPANRFVATFIGSPGMNFMEGEIEGCGEAVSFKSPMGSLKISSADLPPTSSPLSGRWLLGVRPESLVIDVSGKKSQDSLEATVVLSESLGHEIQVVLEVDKKHIIARVSQVDLFGNIQSLKPGDKVGVSVTNPQAMHWFTAEGARAVF